MVCLEPSSTQLPPTLAAGQAVNGPLPLRMRPCRYVYVAPAAKVSGPTGGKSMFTPAGSRAATSNVWMSAAVPPAFVTAKDAVTRLPGSGLSGATDNGVVTVRRAGLGAETVKVE